MIKVSTASANSTKSSMATPSLERKEPLNLAQAAIFSLVALVALVWGSPPMGLICGMLLTLTIGSPIPRIGSKIAKWLLQVSVVLLGFGMDLPTILRTGINGSLFAALTIGATLLLGYGVGRALKINPKTSALISAGTAICGGSAIAAVASVIEVTDGEIAVAMGTVFLLNAVSLYVFPGLGHILQLSQPQFGLWAGIAIHDISSVVGASLGYGPQALEVATAVKLSRTLWIIPVTFAIGLAHNLSASKKAQRKTCGDSGQAKTTPTVPWFIVFFLLASLARSYWPSIAEWSPHISHLARWGFGLVLLFIGSSMSPKTLRTVGWRAALQGVILWVFISAASLFVITYHGASSAVSP